MEKCIHFIEKHQTRFSNLIVPTIGFAISALLGFLNILYEEHSLFEILGILGSLIGLGCIVIMIRSNWVILIVDFIAIFPLSLALNYEIDDRIHTIFMIMTCVNCIPLGMLLFYKLYQRKNYHL